MGGPAPHATPAALPRSRASRPTWRQWPTSCKMSPVSTVLDDLDARPGSSTSLLRTLIGNSMRGEGRWMASATLVALMAEVGVPAERTRTALARVKAKGLLVAETRDGVAGYSLASAALPMLERGDRRIFHPRFMSDGDRWCVISFSIPERNRELRYQIRRRLSWIGCGVVASALWICPAYLLDEVEEIFADFHLADRVTTFLVNEVRSEVTLEEAVGQWWDLTALRKLHDEFLTEHADAVAAFRADPLPRTGFRTWIRALDTWRPIPYLDPGLPPSLLPKDWPGRRSIPLFLDLRDTVGAPAAEFVRSVVTSTGRARKRAS